MPSSLSDEEIVRHINATFAAPGSTFEHCKFKDVSAVKIEKHYPPVKPKAPSELNVWGQFSKVVSHFIERPDIVKQLDANLQQSNKPVVLSALRGLGGIGKTQLAAYYSSSTAAQQRYTFRAWFNAESQEQLEREYISLGQAAGIVAVDDKGTPAEKVAAVKRWLSHKDNHGWLLVYDNAPNYQTVESYLPSEGGQVLITSRHAKWNIKTVDVPLFTKEEAKELIVKQSGYAAEEPALSELIKELECLPLALAQAAAYMKIKLCYHPTPMKEYLLRYRIKRAAQFAEEDTPEYQKRLKKVLGSEVHASVYATFMMNFEELESSPESLQLLYHCSLLASEAISMEVVKESLKINIDSHEKAEAGEEEKASDDNGTFADALLEVEQYSLLQVDREKQSVNLHRVLKVLLQARFNRLDLPKRSLIWRAVAKGLLDSLGKFDSGIQEIRQRTDLIVHVQAVIEALDKVGVKEKDLAWLAERLRSRLSNLIYDAYYTLGNAAQAVAHWKRELVTKESQHGQDNWRVAITLTNLGNAYGDLGDAHKQRDYLERAFKIQEAHWGQDRWKKDHYWKLAITLASLGNAYGDLGDAHKKRDYLELALNMQKAHYGQDHPEVAITLANLGNAYGDLGDAHKKRALVARALKIQEAHYGKDHWRLAITLASLGNAYGDLGDAHKKRGYLEFALNMQEAHYDKDHWQLAITLTNLAMAYIDLGGSNYAKGLLERAIQLKRSHYKDDHHPSIAITHMVLADAYTRLNKPEAAKRLLEEVLACQQNQYGEQYWRLTETFHHLAEAHFALNNADETKCYLEKAHKSKVSHYGEDHWKLWNTLLLSAKCNLQLGQQQVACTELKQAYQLSEQHFGKGHLNTKDIKELLDKAMAVSSINRDTKAYDNPASSVSRFSGVFHQEESRPESSPMLEEISRESGKEEEKSCVTAKQKQEVVESGSRLQG